MVSEMGENDCSQGQKGSVLEGGTFKLVLKDESDFIGWGALFQVKEIA